MDIQKQIEEALKKATPGPWKDGPGCIFVPNDMPSKRINIGVINREADAHLIANAPTWLTHQASIISQQSEEIAKLKEEREKMAQFIRDMIRDGCWNLDGGDLQDKSEKNGFLREEVYDPDKHGEDFDGEPGDLIYVFAGLLEECQTLEQYRKET